MKSQKRLTGVVLILASMVLLTSVVDAQTPTRPREDGEFWLNSGLRTPESKGLYALGMIEGATFLSSGLLTLTYPDLPINTQSVFLKYLGGISAKTVSDGLDSFYAD